jgi:fatty acid synthase
MAIPRLHCSNNKSYLIIDGFTTFGLELIDWLITKGAKYFVVTSTVTKGNDYKNTRLNLLKNNGIQIYLHKQSDLFDVQNIKELLKVASSIGPVEAIFDLQRMNNESSFSHDFINFTTKNLDSESRSSCSELKLFIICSTIINSECSMSIKKLQQLNSIHSSQDQIIEQLLGKRKQDGLHGQMIKWSPINSMNEYNSYTNRNIVLPPLTTFIQNLDEILVAEENIIEVSYIVSPIKKVNMK